MLWNSIRAAGREGLSASHAEQIGIAAAPYARRIMRAWLKGGHLVYLRPADTGRSTSGSYRMVGAALPDAPSVAADQTLIDRQPAAMTPAEFAAIRRQLGLSLTGMGTALGWGGFGSTRSRAMKRFEQGERPIGPDLAARIRVLAKPRRSRRDNPAP